MRAWRPDKYASQACGSTESAPIAPPAMVSAGESLLAMKGAVPLRDATRDGAA